MGTLIDDSGVLRCPVCELEFNHIREVYTRLGTDPAEADVYSGTTQKSTTGDRRRSRLVVELRCEGGHDWELGLQQHKGNIFVESGSVTHRE